MKLGFLLGYSGKEISVPIELIQQAESVGFDSVWTAEAYGNDAVTTASWILAQTKKIKVGTAIMQMPARTPAMCAMTSMSLHQLSGGRFIAGLGASGPQVVLLVSGAQFPSALHQYPRCSNIPPALRTRVARTFGHRCSLHRRRVPNQHGFPCWGQVLRCDLQLTLSELPWPTTPPPPLCDD